MKIVLWGKKLHTDTYSYIHYGFWRAAEYLGYTVEWYGDEDDVSNVDFSNSIFLALSNSISIISSAVISFIFDLADFI